MEGNGPLSFSEAQYLMTTKIGANYRWSVAQILEALKTIGFSFKGKRFTVSDVWYGAHVELEHGLVDPFTNVTNDDMVASVKVALAHLNEHAAYYRALAKMEDELKAEEDALGVLDAEDN